MSPHANKAARCEGESAPRSMGRWEPATLWLLLIVFLGVPPIVKELYPFSLPTMFSAAPRQLARYTVLGPLGEKIELNRVNLHDPEWHDPPVRTLGRNGYGRLDQPSAHHPGEIADAVEVEAAVREGWSRDHELPAILYVTQEVFARGKAGSIQCIARHTWRWTRPTIEQAP